MAEIINDAIFDFSKIDNLNEYLDNKLYDIIGKPKISNTKTILILSGGGSKGLAHIGGFMAMKELNILNNIKTIAGSSAGALMGFLYTIGYTPEELTDFVIMFDIQKIKSIDPSELLNSFGLDSGKRFSLALSKMIEKKNLNPEITFRELYRKTGITLVISATCMNDKQAYYFSHKTNPNMSAALAVRMSISFPIYFTPIIHNEKMYVDGGCSDNYPIQLFIDNINSTVGLYLADSRDYVKEIRNAEDFFINLVECLFESVNNNNIKGFEQYTVNIKIPSVDSMDFNLNDSKKREIIAFGYSAVKKYFEKNSIYIKNVPPSAN